MIPILSPYSVSGLKTLVDKIWPYLLYIVVILLICLGGFYLFKDITESAYERGVEKGKASVVEEYEQKASLLRNNLQIDKGRIEYDALNRINAAKRERDDVVANAYSLRKQLDKVRSIARDAGATVGPGSPADKAVNLLADLLEQSQDRAAIYAGFADDSYDALLTCYNQYTSAEQRINEISTKTSPAVRQRNPSGG